MRHHRTSAFVDVKGGLTFAGVSINDIGGELIKWSPAELINKQVSLFCRMSQETVLFGFYSVIRKSAFEHHLSRIGSVRNIFCTGIIIRSQQVSHSLIVITSKRKADYCMQSPAWIINADCVRNEGKRNTSFETARLYIL